MKKVLFSFMLVLVMLSCSTVKYGTYSSMIDFRYYMDKGFFITQSNSVSFDYEPIGYVQAFSYSGVDDKAKKKYKKDYEQSFYANEGWREANIYDAIEGLYNECLKNGANGVIDLKMDVVVDDETGYVKKAIATGMAIKKKK